MIREIADAVRRVDGGDTAPVPVVGKAAATGPVVKKSLLGKFDLKSMLAKKEKAPASAQ